MEAVEDFGEFGRRNADAAVFNLNMNLPFLAP